MKSLETKQHTGSAVAAILLLIAILGCGGGERPDEGEGGSLSGRVEVDGSSTVFPITEAVAEEFQSKFPGARVTVGISGSGGGFKKFCNGETDLSNASRPIKTSEEELCASNGIRWIELPIAYDGIAVVVHPSNDWAGTITIAELKKLWEPEAQRTVMRWSQVRAGWPDREIRLFGPGVDSGTFDYFTEAVVGEESASRGDFTASEDDNVLVQGIATDPYALGFFGYAYYEENRDRLEALRIAEDGSASGVAPSPETIRDGSYRPLSRPLFLYVREGSLEKPVVSEFVRFYIDNAVTLVREVGYVPLPERAYGLAQQRVDRRATGSIFGGGSQVGVSIEDLLAAGQSQRD